jgi:lipopolysaccharide/colanic/teichoic acid biosynthesis glycosyltransferase
MMPNATDSSECSDISNNHHSSDSETGQGSESRINAWHDCRPRELKPAAGCTVEPRHSWYLPIKRFSDLLCASGLLIVLSPFIAVGALLVKLTSRGPAFYRQVRVGKDGHHFTLYKLRTMRQDAEAETGPVWSTKFDTRVTPLGKLLRTSHIDEFPQLWNVIRGHMSLVGPRPERSEFVAKLDWEVPLYRERLKVRPGITGLAQLRLAADTTIECVRKKVEHDIYYVQHVNPWLDIKLTLFTAVRLFREIVRCAWQCIVLPTDDDIEWGYQQALGTSDDDLGVARFPISMAPQVESRIPVTPTSPPLSSPRREPLSSPRPTVPAAAPTL